MTLIIIKISTNIRILIIIFANKHSLCAFCNLVVLMKLHSGLGFENRMG